MSPSPSLLAVPLVAFAVVQFRRAATTRYDTGFQTAAAALALAAAAALVAVEVVGA